MADHDSVTDDLTAGFFQFQPCTLGCLFSSNGSRRTQKFLPHSIGFTSSHKLNESSEDSYSFPTTNIRPKETAPPEDACPVAEIADTVQFLKAHLVTVPNVIVRMKLLDKNKVMLMRTISYKILSESTSNSEATRETIQMEKKGEHQNSSQRQEKSEINSQCTFSSSPEVPETKSKPKILLVEDNKINAMVTRSMTKQLGHSIDVVSNGVEDVRAVQCRSYDVVLMDVCIPVMDGLKATSLIPSFEEPGNWDAVQVGIEPVIPSSGSTNRSQWMPIIAMTANALSESAEEFHANGKDSFVSKPVLFKN